MTPDEARFYIASIRNFMMWNISAGLSAGEDAVMERLRTGLTGGPPTVGDMMNELVEAAINDDDVRLIVANDGLYEFLLTFERRGALDRLILEGPYCSRYGYRMPLCSSAWVRSAKPLRLMLLEGIYRARNGRGLFLTEDPTGVLTWIRSSPEALKATADTIALDSGALYTPAVQALRVVGDLTIPETWAQGSIGGGLSSGLPGAIEAFRSGIATVNLPVEARGRMAALADAAHARLVGIAGGAMGGSFGGAGSFKFTLPDGTTVTAPRGKPRPWWSNSGLWISGAVGVVVGVGAALKSARR